MLTQVSHVAGGCSFHSLVISPSKSLIENKTQTMKMNDVTEPSRTAVTMIRGAFMRGLKWYELYSWTVPRSRPTLASLQGLSAVSRNFRPDSPSIMCEIASNPVKPNVDCRRPSIKATPPGQPVSLTNVVNTNFPVSYSPLAVDSTTMITVTIPDRLQNKATLSTYGKARTANVLRR